MACCIYSLIASSGSLVAGRNLWTCFILFYSTPNVDDVWAGTATSPFSAIPVHLTLLRSSQNCAVLLEHRTASKLGRRVIPDDHTSFSSRSYTTLL